MHQDLYTRGLDSCETLLRVEVLLKLYYGNEAYGVLTGSSIVKTTVIGLGEATQRPTLSVGKDL
jgi:hypothetical protein